MMEKSVAAAGKTIPVCSQRKSIIHKVFTLNRRNLDVIRVNLLQPRSLRPATTRWTSMKVWTSASAAPQVAAVLLLVL